MWGVYSLLRDTVDGSSWFELFGWWLFFFFFLISLQNILRLEHLLPWCVQCAPPWFVFGVRQHLLILYRTEGHYLSSFVPCPLCRCRSYSVIEVCPMVTVTWTAMALTPLNWSTLMVSVSTASSTTRSVWAVLSILFNCIDPDFWTLVSFDYVVSYIFLYRLIKE